MAPTTSIQTNEGDMKKLSSKTTATSSSTTTTSTVGTSVTTTTTTTTNNSKLQEFVVEERTELDDMTMNRAFDSIVSAQGGINRDPSPVKEKMKTLKANLDFITLSSDEEGEGEEEGDNVGEGKNTTALDHNAPKVLDSSLPSEVITTAAPVPGTMKQVTLPDLMTKTTEKKPPSVPTTNIRLPNPSAPVTPPFPTTSLSILPTIPTSKNVMPMPTFPTTTLSVLPPHAIPSNSNASVSAVPPPPSPNTHPPNLLPNPIPLFTHNPGLGAVTNNTAPPFLLFNGILYGVCGLVSNNNNV